MRILLEDKIEELKETIIEKKPTSIKELAGLIKVSLGSVYRLLELTGIYMLPKRWYIENRIIAANKKGHRTIKSLAQVTEMNPDQVYYYMKEIQGLDILHVPRGRKKIIREKKERKNKKGKTRIAIRDNLIEKGHSLGEIAEKSGKTRARIGQYIQETGQHEIWKELRKKKRQEKKWARQEGKIKRKIISGIIYAVQKSKIESLKPRNLPLEYAFKYVNSQPNIQIPLETIELVLKRYYDAKENNKTLSLKELGKGTGKFPAEISRVIKGAGLEPMFGSRERHSIHPEKKAAVKRAYDTNMSCSDIAHFLGIKRENVYEVMTRFKGKRKRKETKECITQDEYLTDRVSSQIYEAGDLGFSCEETVELLDVSPGIVDYANKFRERIGTRIMGALRVMYPEEEIIKPYKTF